MSEPELLAYIERFGQPRVPRGKTGRKYRARGSFEPRKPADPNHPCSAQSQILIDIRIALLHRRLRPGISLTQDAIAVWAGLTRGAVHMCEIRAMRKIREAMRRRLKLSWTEFTQLRFALEDGSHYAERTPRFGGLWGRD